MKKHIANIITGSRIAFSLPLLFNIWSSEMIKELMHDPIFLAGKSEVATKEDLHVAEELVKLGYTNVKEFGGIIDWEYEIVK